MTRFLFLLVPMLLGSVVCGEGFLVKDGQAQAEILLPEAPTRSQRLAARELQTYLEKISGAQLTIGQTPVGEQPIRIHIGESAATRELGVTTGDLRYGAYRIVSGKDWLVFVGDDTDFVPIEPWARSYQDLRSGDMRREWDTVTGAHYGYPHSQLHKHHYGPNRLFGTPDQPIADKDGNIYMWTYDERGSYNGVCAFLRDLGVRWYMPGEVGEVVPELTDIALPQVDRTVRPDFPMRVLNFRASVYGHDAMMYGFRLGTRQPFGRQAAHGLATLVAHPLVAEEHPEWFALYGGERQNTDSRASKRQLCLSNPELLQAAIHFAQVQFDHYDMDVVSIWPPDGYTAMCQCALCEGKESPELGERGRLSNYVWDFVNEVAKELQKTHPDRLISNGAYGIYTEPPSNIDKLEPNIQVIIVGARRLTDPDKERLRELRQAWSEKTDNLLENFENYPFTGRGFYVPAYDPGLFEEINEMKDSFRGEDIWITMDFSDDAIGYNHFLLYFTAHMYWGGKEADPQAMFDEYVRLFYGPVAGEMGAFFSYCAENWREMTEDVAVVEEALSLFEQAKAAVPAESVFAERIHHIDLFLETLRQKRTMLAQTRGPVSQLRLVGEPQGMIVIDGKLDEEAWVNNPIASRGRLQELQTGREPIYGTSVKATWQGSNLYFAIRCEEAPGVPLNITATENGDQALWYGDAVEILLATNAHSYYQIAVNPAGALLDLDRGTDRYSWFKWDAQAEVATQIADDHWTVEIRIPVTDDSNDPNHKVIGRKPLRNLPWHINICRQRIRGNHSELSALSPTARPGFHVPMKFAHFFAGNSHTFKADPSVTDYIIASRAADNLLLREHRTEAALEAYLALLDLEEITDFQKADALYQAAAIARGLNRQEQVAELTARIPIPAVQKTAIMHNLLAQDNEAGVIEQFGGESWEEWPFWQVGAGAYARGRAYYRAGQGAKAAADLKTAMTYTVDSRVLTNIAYLMGQNYEQNLQDEAAALEAYRRNFQGLPSIGGANQFRSVQGVVRILLGQGKHDEALATLEQTHHNHAKGFWHNTMQLTLAKVHAAAGRLEEAKAIYQQVASDEDARKSLRAAAEEALSQLTTPEPDTGDAPE